MPMIKTKFWYLEEEGGSLLLEHRALSVVLNKA